MSYKGFQESRQRLSNSLSGQRWIFLKNGLDDFRDGFLPSPGNMLVSGRKQPVSITLENSTPRSLSRAQQKKRNQCSRAQVCLSKLSLLQQARKDYVAQTECSLSQHPSVCYPCLDKSTSPKILREVAGVLDPDMTLKSKAGYSDYEQENQPGQEVLGHMEDMQSKVTASKTQIIKGCFTLYCINTCSGKESRVKTPCAQLPKKAAERIKEATLTEFVPRDENVKRATKHFCDWVMSLVPSQTKWEKIRYGAWYLDPKTWRKQKANEPSKEPEATINSLGSAKNWSEKVLGKSKAASFFCDIAMRFSHRDVSGHFIVLGSYKQMWNRPCNPS
ncbi:protein FAM47E [Amazona ochrocephala]